MGRVHLLALAVVVVLAGCPGGSGDHGTVTPAPVATPPTQSPSSTPVPCDVPTVAPPADGDPSAPQTNGGGRVPPADGGTPSTPTGGDTPTPQTPTVAVPVQNGTVNATALVDRHDRVLHNYSYELRGPDYLLQVDPAASALRARVRKPLSSVRHYVVDGTRYTYSFRQGGQARYQVHSYDADRFRGGFGSVYSLTGSRRVHEALSLWPHRVEERRPDGWVVLTAADPPSGDDVIDRQAGDGRVVHSLNSTVLVDRRGIVRSVEQEYTLVTENDTRRTFQRSLNVTDVGTATVERPRWVCVAERNGHLSVP